MSIGSYGMRGVELWRLRNLTHYGLSDVPADAVVVQDRHFFDTQIVEIAGGGGQLFWAKRTTFATDLLESGPVSEEVGIRDTCSVAGFGLLDLAASRLGAAGLPIDNQ